MKVSGKILTNLFAAIFLCFAIISCSPSDFFSSSQNNQTRSSDAAQWGSVYQNSFSVPGQKIPPPEIKSIELYRRGNRGGPPVIQLGSSQRFVLQFDELGTSHSAFTVRFTHHNADWSRSNLIPNFYIRGFHNDQIVGHRPSNVQNPAYSNYTYEFPHENLQLLVSGNYMIHIHKFENDQHLFSMPFMLHEDEGSLEIEIEEVFGLDSRYTLHHQVFSEYHYPDFITMPQIDLRVFYVQNQFFGRMRQADQTDMSRQGIYRTYTSRNQPFIGRYEFRTLPINRIDQTGSTIIDYRPETIPPRIVLFRDVVNLDVSPRHSSGNPFGRPRSDLDARYADVRFELEIPESEIPDNLPVYLVGPFNNWAVNERNRMRYNAGSRTFLGNAIVKEGTYDYKYVILDGDYIDDVRLDASFADSKQRYATLIYYRDPQEQIDRLLKFSQIRSR